MVRRLARSSVVDPSAIGTSGPTPRPTGAPQQLGEQLRWARPGPSTRTTGQYYLHNHLSEQPDLNWWNEEVRSEFDEIFRFWFDRGVAGFRIDVCNIIIKDALLRDNPPATEDDDFEAQLFGQRPVYNGNRPEVHDVIRRWRALADSYDTPRTLIGETPVKVDGVGRATTATAPTSSTSPSTSRSSPPPSTPVAMRQVVEDTEALLPPGAWPAWTGSNHDMSRFASRWADGDARKARVALLMLLCLRGTPVLYQGDEIGLERRPRRPQTTCATPSASATGPPTPGATPCARPCRGVTGPAVASPSRTHARGSRWGRPRACNVEDNGPTPSSMLALARDLIALRRRAPELQTGRYETMPASRGGVGLAPGDRIVVVLNMSDDDATPRGGAGRDPHRHRSRARRRALRRRP